MAADQLFHKRKLRLAETFQRRIEWREQNKVALVVCQGSRSEPNYLHGLKRALGLSNANLVIVESGQGRDSLNVVRVGIAEFQKDPGAYDKVFCVFDKDSDPHYKNALQLARTHELAKKKLLLGINSVPCFELWLLLHYEYTTREFVRTGQKSPADNVISELSAKGRIPGYQKNHKRIYEVVADRTDTAIKNALQLAKYNSATHSPDASETKMHELVAYLRSIVPK
jgi:RloB-like protein